jgi:Phospholipid methyltransferase
MLAAVGRFAVRWRRWVLAGTPLAVVVAGALGGGVFDRLSGGGFSDPDAEPSRARDQLERVFGAGDPNLVLLVTAKRGSVDDPATAAVGAAPTRQLVVGGPYRYVRNPMYLAVVAVIVGQALALGQPGLLGYAAAVAGAMAAFAHGYEEPTLRRQFGAQYQAYRQAVPAWWPRRHPWQPGQANQPIGQERERRHG